jgi:hypothetical protein
MSGPVASLSDNRADLRNQPLYPARYPHRSAALRRTLGILIAQNHSLDGADELIRVELAWELKLNYAPYLVKWRGFMFVLVSCLSN